MNVNGTYSDAFVCALVQNLEDRNNYKTICQMDEQQHSIVDFDLSFRQGQCISNAFRLAEIVLGANTKVDKLFLVEGIVVASTGLLFKHMWNKIIINEKSYEIDVTHDLFMSNTKLVYLPIIEYEYEELNHNENFGFTCLVEQLEQIYWNKHPESIPQK